MSGQKYILLLNECLKKALPSMGAKEKERLTEKLEFLRAGLWDAGLRVKKLKGSLGRVVFEARFSRSDRMLFTLGRKGSQTAVYLWGLIGHDEVNRTARRVLPENAPFLDFTSESEEDYPEVILDELPMAFYSQEAIEAQVPDDYGPQRWLVLDDEEWERLRKAGKPGELELFLYLTEEQAQVLEASPPVLISGTAGSGKTTLAVYYLLKPEFAGRRKLFLTYNPFLRDFSRRLFAGLSAPTSLEDIASRPDFYVFRDLLRDLLGPAVGAFNPDREVRLREFETLFRNHRLYGRYDAELVWEEVRSIIKGAKPVLRLERWKSLSLAYLKGPQSRDRVLELKEGLLGLVNLETASKIQAFLQSKTGFAGLEGLARSLTSDENLWRKEQGQALLEIFRIMEKKSRNLDSPLLTYPEYVKLGRKRAPNFLYERRELYEIAEYYQGKLEEQGLWDEIDLCRRVLDRLGQGADNRTLYDLVVCDEVQDFANVQLTLIFRLAGSPEKVVLAGDTKQIINPSGFRWEEVRNSFFEQGIQVPRVHSLRINFRCVGNVVKLANALLDLKQRLIGLTGSEIREEWKFNGRPPFLLTEPEEEKILSQLRMRAAGQVILVRDREEQTRLKQVLGTELVFTIQEAKGLEFDTVLVWKFSADPKSAPLWRRIRHGSGLDRSGQPHLRQEINLLYVAITRARNTLIVYDPGAEIWNLPELGELLFSTSDPEALPRLWHRVSSPEEWADQGDYFLDREHYPVALECYKNAGNLDRTEIAQAFVWEQRNQFREAAPLFEKHGYWDHAGAGYERSGLWEKALGIWDKLKNQERAALCRIALYEQRGDYDRAAEEWLKRKEIVKALDNWRKAGNHQRLGEYLTAAKKYPEAAEAFAAGRLYEQAAVLFKRLKKLDRAADLFYQAGNWLEAAVLYKRLKNPGRLLECYIKGEDDYRAALLHEKNGDLAAAMEAFTRFARTGEEQTALLEKEKIQAVLKKNLLKAAVRSFALGQYRESADFFTKKGYYDLALPQYQALGDHEKAADCFYNLEDYYQAALEIEQSRLPDKWEQAADLLSFHLGQGRREARMELKLLQEGEQFLEEGAPDRALVRFKTVNAPDLVRAAYRKTGRDEEALDYFLRDNRLEEAGRYVKEAEGLKISLPFLQAVMHKYLETDNHYRLRTEAQVFIAEVLGRLLEKGNKEDYRSGLEQFISSLPFWGSSLPAPVFNFLLQSRYYNGIFEAVREGTLFAKSISPNLKKFIAELKRLAAQEKDPTLLACYQFYRDKDAFETSLDRLELTGWNYQLFGESSRYYRQTVEFLLGERKTEEAVYLSRRHRNFHLTGEILEEAKFYSEAGRAYRDGGHNQEALRCFKLIGDEAGVARVYERLNRLEEALGLWKKRGNLREAARLQKKVDQRKTAGSQLSLFKNG
ncbi:MAG: UvrD-helicase domain-containing protein [Deltaproteobacteria bacterium]|nr:UvrD-helicase domain-containing protein [Deltaproteobacteria bacterium]